MAQLLVGVGQEIITPPLGTMLQGYTPARPALSVHDDLHATAFAFETAGERALLISVDMCNMRFLQEDIRAAITEASGVADDHIIVACTHTHSGPHSCWDIDQRPNIMHDHIIPLFAKAAATAVAALRPAQMGIGTTYSDVAVNRRMIREDGKLVLGQNPHGSWDPTMTVVAFREPDGTPIGNLIHYGCHNTASGKSDEITRDWCGVAIDRLQAISGGVTAFINGCGGDCGPRLPNGQTTGDVQMAMELGGKAGIDAVRAWRSIRQWHDAPLRVMHGEVEMPLQDVGTVDDVLAEAAKLGEPDKLKGTVRRSYDHLMDRVEFLRQGNIPPKSERIPHTLFALGPLAIQPLPFEPFSLITLRIKDASPFPYTLCVGYANGMRGYFPSMDQMVWGGYEVRMFKTINLIPYTEDAEQHYVAGSLKLLREFYEQ